MKKKYFDRVLKFYKLVVYDGLTLREIEKMTGLSRTTIYNDLTTRLKKIDIVKYEDVIEQFKLNHEHLCEYNRNRRKDERQ
jgi:predicted DNA-binding protein (UPF0251 family)